MDRQRIADLPLNGRQITQLMAIQASVIPRANPDAVQEFSVQKSNFSAEYANATGAMSVVTKSGTNEFHGSAFEFLRNGAFNARNFFAARRDSLKRSQFGGTLGGPRGFAPIIDPQTGVQFPDNQIPEQRLNPVTLAFLKYIPDPGTPDGQRFVGVPVKTGEDELTAKVAASHFLFHRGRIEPLAAWARRSRTW